MGLRPSRTAPDTLEGRSLEGPSCGGPVPTAETTVNPAHACPEPTTRTRRGLEAGLRRWDLACAPLPHPRCGLDDRTDPGPLGAPATRLRSALSRGQFAPQPQWRI